MTGYFTRKVLRSKHDGGPVPDDVELIDDAQAIDTVRRWAKAQDLCTEGMTVEQMLQVWLDMQAWQGSVT